MTITVCAVRVRRSSASGARGRARKRSKPVFKILHALTDFGDSAVLLPVAMVIFAWLLIARSPSASVWWLGALSLTIELTATFKVYFVSCPLAGGLRSPSGHSGLSVAVYGGIAVIFASDRVAKWERIAIWLGGLGIAASIGVSRILLGRHTVFEVLVGFLIGLSGVAVFSYGYGRSAKRRVALLSLIVLIVLALALLHGRKLNLEYLFKLLSDWLGIRALACSATP